MADIRYPAETLHPDIDNGTMPDNVEMLASAVVGHRIVKATKESNLPHKWYSSASGLVLELDNGKRVTLYNTDDCCAYTEIQSIVEHLPAIDHVITGVGTTGEFARWHIYADMGDVLELSVGWSPGNAFYYGYGFDIKVSEITDKG